MKNYKYIFWFILDVAITNTFILHSKFTVLTPSSNEQQRLKWFCLQLAESFIGNYNSQQRIGRPRSSANHAQPTAVPHQELPSASLLLKATSPLPSPPSSPLHDAAEARKYSN